jgi:large conductance mechanosensitive channel
MFKNFFAEYKAFIQRGNVLDLAVGVIIGAAFGKITTSLVDDILMPPIGFLIGGVEFDKLSILLQVSPSRPAVSIDYGNFLQSVIDFLVIAFVVFLIVKAVNAMKKEPEAPEATPPQELLLAEIRDLLKQQQK